LASAWINVGGSHTYKQITVKLEVAQQFSLNRTSIKGSLHGWRVETLLSPTMRAKPNKQGRQQNFPWNLHITALSELLKAVIHAWKKRIVSLDKEKHPPVMRFRPHYSYVQCLHKMQMCRHKGELHISLYIQLHISCTK
jgi:hypothetical protein